MADTIKRSALPIIEPMQQPPKGWVKDPVFNCHFKHDLGAMYWHVWVKSWRAKTGRIMPAGWAHMKVCA